MKKKFEDLEIGQEFRHNHLKWKKTIPGQENLDFGRKRAYNARVAEGEDKGFTAWFNKNLKVEIIQDE